MGPRGPSRAPKYRKPTFAKTLKNHWFFKVFGGPRPSKTASKDPKSPPRGYLGLLEAILSHLGAILKTRAFKRAPAGWGRCWFPPSWLILGPIFEPKIDLFFNFWGVIFRTSFWTTLGAILGSILGPDRAKKGPKCSQEGHQRLQRPKKLHLQKP